jgi:hypothetical protein
MFLLWSGRRVFGGPARSEKRRGERLVADASEATAVVIGRWTGTHRIQVKLEDGGYEVVESPQNSADDVDPGDEVIITFDSEGHPVDWRRAPRP